MAVKIVTVHVSKGLEYPVIFCPYMWGGIRNNDEVATCHDDTGMVKDFGSGSYRDNRSLAQKESLAESLRLLYVAVTRAKYRCYLAAGKIVDTTGKNRPETSPLAYLLHASDTTRTATDLVERLAAEIKGLSDDDMSGQLRELERGSAGTIAVVPPPEAAPGYCVAPDRDDVRQLVCRKFSGTVADDWRVASFTSFAAHETAAAELPDRDETQQAPVTPEAATVEAPAGRSIFTFPRGARAGIFLHEIFEHLDFAAVSGPAVDALVAKGLEKHGFEPEWRQHVSGMVRNVVETEISITGQTMSLAGLDTGHWITELEFFLPLSFITSDILGGYFRKWGVSGGGADLTRICAALSFRPVRGMVRGFMDMVFCHGGRYYLVDWKSNHLGNRVEDYGRETLARAMEQNLYPLQYLLYTVALNNYLSLRVEGYDYESHFGGVIYVFLRGVSPEAGEQFGIYRDRPPVGMIDELTALLVEKAGRH
jgi:exodeoxyribonuclease V beta subunit